MKRAPKSTRPRRRFPPEVRHQRIEQEIVRGDGWSMDSADKLAAELGCTRRTIERDYQLIVERLRDTERTGRETRRAEFLRRLQEVQQEALDDRKFAALATLMNLEARVQGLDVPPPEPVDPPESADGATSLEQHLAEVRRLRLDAQSRGAMTAAAALLARELEAHEAIAAEQRAAEEAARLATDPDLILQRFADDAQRLPAPLVVDMIEILRRLLPGGGDE